MIKVMIADDQELIRESLKVVVDMNPDMQVTGLAADGAELIAAVAQAPPDVILMDVRMPRVDGVAATEEIKRRFPQVRIIILTTFDDDEYIYNALKYGASGYLLKGVSVAELAAAIRKVVAGGSLLNPDVATKALQLFSRMARQNIAIEVDERGVAELIDGTEYRQSRRLRPLEQGNRRAAEPLGWHGAQRPVLLPVEAGSARSDAAGYLGRGARLGRPGADIVSRWQAGWLVALRRRTAGWRSRAVRWWQQLVPRERLFYRLAAAAIVVVGVAAGWQQAFPPGPRILTVGIYAGSPWDVPQGQAYAFIDSVIARYETQHPGVKVRYTSGVTRTDYPEWLAERFLAGDEPDVFLIAGPELPQMVRFGAVQELDGFLQHDDSFDREAYFPQIMAYGQQDGHQYALPVECVPTLMFVNKTLLAREGIPMPDADWTWQDFLAICRRVTRDTDGDGRIDQFGCYDFDWRQAFVTNGGQLFRNDGRAVHLTAPAMQETLDLLRALKSLNAGYSVTARDFDLGHVAFRPLDFAQYRTYQPYPWRIKKYSSFDWECVPMPRGPSGPGGGTAPMQALLAGMSARSAEPELAWEFLRELTSAESGRQLLSTEAGLPPRRDVLRSGAAQLTLASELPASALVPAELVSVMEHGWLPPRFARYDEAMLRVNSGLSRLLDDTTQPYSEALTRLQRDINAFLQQ